MIDTKIINYVDKCNEKTVSTITKALDIRFESLTQLIAVDNQNLRDKIKEVGDHVKEQNGSVRNLNEWRAECGGMEKQKLSSQQRAKIFISAIIGIAGIVVSLILKLL